MDWNEGFGMMDWNFGSTEFPYFFGLIAVCFLVIVFLILFRRIFDARDKNTSHISRNYEIPAQNTKSTQSYKEMNEKKSYCTHCGFPLNNQEIKFCPECGAATS